MKNHRLSAYQRQRFQLIKILAEFAEEKSFATDYDRLVLALCRTQHHQTSRRGASCTFLKREQIARFKQMRNRVQHAGARHCFFGAQRCVGKKRERAIAKQHGHVGAIWRRNLFAVMKTEQIVDVRRIQKRVGAAFAKDCRDQGRAEPRRLRDLFRCFERGVARETRGGLEPLASF